MTVQRRGRSRVGSHRRGVDQVDDATGLAGWMYTDLLLGLAVTFLGSVGFVLASRDAPPVDAEGDTPVVATSTTTTSTTSTTSTTTTTTLPPEQCTILYSPAEAEDDGIEIRLDSRSDDGELAQQFTSQLTERIGRENRVLEQSESPLPPFEFDSFNVGIVIAIADGQSGEAARVRSAEVVSRLKRLFPDQLGSTALRRFWDTNNPNGVEVDLEFFPTVTLDCLLAADIGS